MPEFVIFGKPMGGFLASAEKAGALLVLDDKMRPILKQIRRACFSQKVNSVISIPFKEIWSRLSMRNVPVSHDADVYFIFCEGYATAYSEECLRYFRENYRHAKLVHYFRNPIAGLTGTLTAWQKVRHLYDASITFNKSDAEKYGILYTDYWPCILPEKSFQPENASDVFFVGHAKDRLPQILSVYERLADAGLRCDFWITGVPESEQRHSGVIHYNSPIPYGEVCQHVMNTKCVLEILPFGQNYSSLRPLEALTYRRKLLTTNINAPSEWFYHPEIVQVFREAGNIDTRFITDTLTPDDERRIFGGMNIGDFSVFTDFLVRNVHRKDS